MKQTLKYIASLWQIPTDAIEYDIYSHLPTYHMNNVNHDNYSYIGYKTRGPWWFKPHKKF